MSHVFMSRELCVMLCIEIHKMHEYIYTIESRVRSHVTYLNESELWVMSRIEIQSCRA